MLRFQQKRYIQHNHRTTHPHVKETVSYYIKYDPKVCNSVSLAPFCSIFEYQFPLCTSIGVLLTKPFPPLASCALSRWMTIRSNYLRSNYENNPKKILGFTALCKYTIYHQLNQRSTTFRFVVFSPPLGKAVTILDALIEQQECVAFLQLRNANNYYEDRDSFVAGPLDNALHCRFLGIQLFPVPLFVGDYD
jgi:hypothetical protein